MTAHDPAAALLAAFAARLGPLTDVRCRTVDWQSATFIGQRHRFELTVAAAVPNDFAEAIAEAEIALRRGFVADVAVTDRRAGANGTRLTIEALTIDDD